MLPCEYYPRFTYTFFLGWTLCIGMLAYLLFGLYHGFITLPTMLLLILGFIMHPITLRRQCRERCHTHNERIPVKEVRTPGSWICCSQVSHYQQYQLITMYYVVFCLSRHWSSMSTDRCWTVRCVNNYKRDKSAKNRSAFNCFHPEFPSRDWWSSSDFSSQKSDFRARSSWHSWLISNEMHD